MHRILPIRAVIAGLVAAVVSLTVLAGPASAAPATDLVRLSAINADFGDNSWVNNAPVGFGTLAYDVSSGTTITPRLVGYLHVNNAKGMHTRMQLRYFDVFGAELTPAQVGGTVTANDNLHHVWSVNLAPYSNPAIYRVNVSTTYEGSTGWLTISAANFYV
jgi:hypothetical protein